MLNVDSSVCVAGMAVHIPFFYTFNINDLLDTDIVFVFRYEFIIIMIPACKKRRTTKTQKSRAEQRETEREEKNVLYNEACMEWKFPLARSENLRRFNSL